MISEDDKFYMHQGFDWSEIKNSFLANLRAFSFIRGGSTISQQLVKNLYLSQDKNLARKMKEAILAYQVEKKFKKDLIFERYLNMIEWGQNVWGVQAASQHYFKKSPGDLSLLESVYLAVIIPSPKKYDRLFREEGDLTSYQVRKIKLLLERLERKKVIGSQDKMEAEELILSFPWGDSINLDEEFFDYMYE